MVISTHMREAVSDAGEYFALPVLGGEKAKSALIITECGLAWPSGMVRALQYEPFFRHRTDWKATFTMTLFPSSNLQKFNFIEPETLAMVHEVICENAYIAQSLIPLHPVAQNVARRGPITGRTYQEHIPGDHHITGFPGSLIEFQQRFGDEAACAQYLIATRWPDGFICPGSGGGKA